LIIEQGVPADTVFNRFQLVHHFFIKHTLARRKLSDSTIYL
jgi:hypothetical protein